MVATVLPPGRILRAVTGKGWPLRRGRLGLLPVLRRGLAICLLLIAGLAPGLSSLTAARAQETPSIVALLKGPDRSSPEAWIASFTAEAQKLDTLLRAYGADRSSASLRAYTRQLDVFADFFELEQIPAAFRTAAANEATAIMIDILNRLPPMPQPGSPAPGTTVELPPMWMIPGTEIALIRRTEGVDAGNYVLPRSVILQLRGYHDLVMTLSMTKEGMFSDMRATQANLTGPHFPTPVARTLSGWIEGSLLGAPAWKMVVITLLALIALVGNLLLYRWITFVAARHSLASGAVMKLIGPLILMVSTSAMTVFFQTQVLIGGNAALVVALVRNLILIFASAWAALALSNVIAEWLIAPGHDPDKGMDADLTRFVGKTLGIFAALAIVVYGLGTVGVPTAGIITSLGVGGVGIAFATRVTMENLFGGFLLLVDRPFRIGDHIKIVSGEGIVTDIGVRSCRIRTLEGNTLTIPNGVLSASAITMIRQRDPDAGEA